MRARKGITPMLSVMILIGMSIIGGTILYSVQTQVLSTGLSNVKLGITDLKMEKDSTGSCYFQSTVYNSGTESVKLINLKTTLDSGEDFDFGGGFVFGNSLVPGNSTEKIFHLPNDDPGCEGFTVSNTYSVLFDATSWSSDESINSDFSIIKAMKVENVMVP